MMQLWVCVVLLLVRIMMAVLLLLVLLLEQMILALVLRNGGHVLQVTLFVIVDRRRCAVVVLLLGRLLLVLQQWRRFHQRHHRGRLQMVLVRMLLLRRRRLVMLRLLLPVMVMRLMLRMMVLVVHRVQLLANDRRTPNAVLQLLHWHGFGKQLLLLLMNGQRQRCRLAIRHCRRCRHRCMAIGRRHRGRILQIDGVRGGGGLARLVRRMWPIVMVQRWRQHGHAALERGRRQGGRFRVQRLR